MNDKEKIKHIVKRVQDNCDYPLDKELSKFYFHLLIGLKNEEFLKQLQEFNFNDKVRNIDCHNEDCKEQLCSHIRKQLYELFDDLIEGLQKNG